LGINQLESIGFEFIKGRLSVLHTKRDMGEATAAPLLPDLLGHRRLLIQGFEKLNQVIAVSNLQENLSYLIPAINLFPVNHPESHSLVERYLGV